MGILHFTFAYPFPLIYKYFVGWITSIQTVLNHAQATNSQVLDNQAGAPAASRRRVFPRDLPGNGTDSATALPTRYLGPRVFSTSIYFLLAGTQISTLHRLASDEQWHFYDGNALLLDMITPDGTSREVRLGRRATAGEQFQAVIPAGTWMGARLASRRGYALIGCTVAPGFEFQDFTAGRRPHLIEQFPQHRKLITALTRAG